MSHEQDGTQLTWSSPRLRMRVLFTAFLIAFLCYGFFSWVLWPVKVMGDSMTPNYHNGERHFINKLAYRTARPRRGDVIGLYAGNGDIYIKRILGLPGETIVLTNGGILVNGKTLQEPYVNTRIPKRREEDALQGTLGPDQYFVIGDNRATTVFGFVPEKDIIGKVVF
jgi:signal peptidase I